MHGHIVDSQDQVVQDIISTRLAQLSHGNATNPIGEFNEQFEGLQECRKLMPVWEEDINFNALEITEAKCKFGSANNASARGNKDSEHEYSPLNEVTGSGDSSSETDHEDLKSILVDPKLETALRLMESLTLQCVDEDDVALDMDGWDLDGNSDNDLSDEGKSEEEEGFDFS